MRLSGWPEAVLWLVLNAGREGQVRRWPASLNSLPPLNLVPQLTFQSRISQHYTGNSSLTFVLLQFY
jgi:hypothetical protein